jgi:CHASE2 domain-containing sensor protein
MNGILEVMEMPVGFSVVLFLLGTTGAVGSYIYRRKQSSTRFSAIMVAGMISCLLAVGAACYLLAALLLIRGID